MPPPQKPSICRQASSLEESQEFCRHARCGVAPLAGAGLQQGGALPAVRAVVGFSAVADLGPKRRSAQPLIVDDHRELVAGIHDFRQVAIV